jgi:hypothetical protein
MILASVYMISVALAASGDTNVVSVNGGGNAYSSLTERSSVSGDGRYVSFRTQQKLTPGHTNREWQIYVRDRVDNTTTLVSVNNSSRVDGTLQHNVQSDQGASFSAMSDDGRYVAFVTHSNNFNMG